MCQSHGYTVLCDEHIPSCLILSNNLIREILLYLFYGEQRAVQRGGLTFPGSHSMSVRADCWLFCLQGSPAIPSVLRLARSLLQNGVFPITKKSVKNTGFPR